MPPILLSLANRLPLSAAVSRHGMWRLAPTATLHLAALAVLLWSETDFVPKLAFVLSWGLLNCFWLALLRRPALAAALSLGLIVGLIAISRFKVKVLWMTANFIDVLIIDADTGPLLVDFPTVRIRVARPRCRKAVVPVVERSAADTAAHGTAGSAARLAAPIPRSVPLEHG